MGETTGIAWTDHTFNPWWGCTEVSPGCDHCYARELAKRWRKMDWGPGAPRVPTSEANWRNPFKWNNEAEDEGRRHRVFTLSMGDLFDAEAPEDARQRLWRTIEQTPWLDWQLLTKRPANISLMVPPAWMDVEWPSNAWIGTSVEDDHQRHRASELCRIPAPVRFLSVEPMIGPVSLEADCVSIPWGGGPAHGGRSYTPVWSMMDWVIIGGESGSKARPMDLEWVRRLRAEAQQHHTAVFVKQLGACPVLANHDARLKHKKGEDPSEWPVDLRVQEFPEPRVGVSS